MSKAHMVILNLNTTEYDNGTRTELCTIRSSTNVENTQYYVSCI